MVLAALALCLCASPASGQAPAPNPPPATAPAAIAAPVGAAESAAGMLLQQARAAKAQARANSGEAAARKAGNDLLVRVTAQYPQTSAADDANLQLLEDGLCLTDAGYPECAALAIRGYEAFLAAYPYTDRKAYALKRLAANYLDLSFRYEEDEPWQSPEKAELCLGRALQLAEMLAARPEPEAAFGRELAGRIRASGKAFSIVPGLGAAQ